MNRLLKTLASLAATTATALALLTAPVAEAQGRGRQTHTSQQGSQAPSRSSKISNTNRPQRPVQNNRPERVTNRPLREQQAVKKEPMHSTRPTDAVRPGGNGNRPGQGNVNNGNNRPGNNNGFRPGNNNGNGNRPGNGNVNNGNHNGNNRPGNGNVGNGNHNRPGHDNGFRPGGNNAHRPGNGHGPHHGHGYDRPAPPPAHRPGYRRPPMVRPGYRHPLPFFNNWHRPVPPPSWRYRPGYGPSFGTILGITLGATIDFSLNALYNSGYNVVNYGNNVVYLSNVPQMNLIWPEAALYYNNGLLYGSQFTYPTAYYDMSRYNTLYNVFMNQYGMPIQTTNAGGIISATWYGADNRFVTIQFSPLNGRYYTTLSFGN